jgi:hypothetical protein
MVPLVMVPMSWWVALRRRAGTLMAVAAIDTVLGLALALAILTQGAPPAPEADPPRIGVQLDASFPGEGARVLTVWPDSPAEEAGLAAGDVIVAVEGEPVGSWEGLTEALEHGKTASQRLTVKRDGEVLELAVAARSGLGSARPRDLFEPTPGARCSRAAVSEVPRALWPLAALAVVVGAAVVLERTRARRQAHPARSRWAWVLLPMVVAPVASAGAELGACELAGGSSLGTLLVALLAQGLTLCALGGLLYRWLGAELTMLVGPRLSNARATSLAVFYVLAAMARALTALYILFTLVPDLAENRGQQIQTILDGATSPLARAMVITAAVVIAPLGEELIFRGILLPGLARSSRPGTALAVSSIVFALVHVPSHGPSAVFPGVLGLVLGWTRLRTGGLAVPIVLHAANNLLVTLLAWLL